MLVRLRRYNLLWIAIIIASLLLVLPSSRALGKAQSDGASNRIDFSPTLSQAIRRVDSSPPVEFPEVKTIYIPINTAEMQSNGFSLAAVVMGWMVVSLLYVGITYVRGMSALPRIFILRWLQNALPLLCLIGLGVAGYLSYVEIFVVKAVCGPVGDCNAVQSSPYARLFGVLPIGVLGIGGYLAILGAWFYPRLRGDRWANFTPVAILCMAIFGVIFSVYLTYLEIYVIKAVCMWCITSAVIMTLLLMLSLAPALQAMDVEEDQDDE